MKTQTITPTEAKELIKNSTDIISVTFTKKDGSTRTMACRSKVLSHLRGGKSTVANYSNYVTVYDMNKHGYRNINIQKIHSIKKFGEIYTVSANS